MPQPTVTLPDDASARTVRRSRVVSYVLAGTAAVVLSIAPSVLGDPHQAPWHTLLHVVRPIVAVVLVVAAVAVQLVVGLQWHAGLRRRAAEDDPSTDRRAPRDTGPADR